MAGQRSCSGMAPLCLISGTSNGLSLQAVEGQVHDFQRDTSQFGSSKTPALEEGPR